MSDPQSPDKFQLEEFMGVFTTGLLRVPLLLRCSTLGHSNNTASANII